jgi:hypothetical protein
VAVVTVSALEDAVRNLADVTESVMFNGYAWIGQYPCVACGKEKPEHEPDCELDEALRRLWAEL